MATCFVIQPFDSGKFDKRFQDIYKPAIEAAGLEAYRTDHDPNVDVPIESVEKGIRLADICLADITEDNPNVWYELGYAYASKRQVIMLCSKERPEENYPFDIRHRSIIRYSTDSPSDFDRLRDSLTARIAAIRKQDAVLDKIAQADPISPVHGLSQSEILMLALIAGNADFPDHTTDAYSVKQSAERAGITNMVFNLTLRRLLKKELIEEQEIFDERFNQRCLGYFVTDAGWAWIDANDTLFVLGRAEKKDDPHFDDDMPF